VFSACPRRVRHPLTRRSCPGRRRPPPPSRVRASVHLVGLIVGYDRRNPAVAILENGYAAIEIVTENSDEPTHRKEPDRRAGGVDRGSLPHGDYSTDIADHYPAISYLLNSAAPHSGHWSVSGPTVAPHRRHSTTTTVLVPGSSRVSIPRVPMTHRTRAARLIMRGRSQTLKTRINGSSHAPPRLELSHAPSRDALSHAPSRLQTNSDALNSDGARSVVSGFPGRGCRSSTRERRRDAHLDRVSRLRDGRQSGATDAACVSGLTLCRLSVASRAK